MAGHGLGGVPLAGLAARMEASVRLRNALSNAGPGVRLRTVGDYLEAGAAAGPMLLADVRNLGRRTADELDALVARAVAGWDPATGALPGEDLGAEDDGAEDARKLALLEAAFGDERVGEVLGADFLSTRLARVVRGAGFSGRRFAAVAADLPGVAAELLRGDNIGARSVREFRELVEARVAERLAAQGNATVPSAVPLPATHGALPHPRDLEDLLSQAIAELPDRAAEVVRRRYGIGQDGMETLEALGAAFRLTRERIRQIEDKTLKRIRVRVRKERLAAALADRMDELWAAIGDGDGVPSHDMADVRQRVPPFHALALDLCRQSLADWLDGSALRLEHGWHRDRGDASQLADIAREISSAEARGVLPIALAGVVPSRSVALARVAARLALGLQVDAGYLVRGRVGIRLGRAIRLHALLARSAAPVGLGALVPRYVAHWPGDPCTVRDAAIVMEAAPHLFLEVQDGEWLAIGEGGDLPAQPARGAVGRTPPPTPDPSEATVAATLSAVLAEAGPSRFIEIYDRAAALLPAGRSANSIGPTLLTQGDLFARPLPGVYALREQLEAMMGRPAAAAPYLLNETQARLFALARRAGEPWGAFPMWRPETEHRLCEWARLSASPDCFRSLLAAASVRDWPIGPDLRDEWVRRVALQGRFTLSAPLKPAAYALPAVDRVLAASIHLLSRGSLSWMAANRICGRRIDAHHGAGLVALMVSLGAARLPVEDPRDWQLAHAAGPRLEEVRAELAGELHRSGALSWGSGAGARLAASVRHARPGDRGWLDVDRVAGMWDHGEPEDGDEGGSEADAAERMLLERRRTLETRRREDTLRWLLSE